MALNFFFDHYLGFVNLQTKDYITFVRCFERSVRIQSAEVIKSLD